MILSQTAEYAVRAVVHLAGLPRQRLTRAADVSRALGIPRNYLSKILHVLGHRGVLASVRGKAGGFRLARPPGEITLLAVVGQFDEMESRRTCLLRRDACSDRTPCTAHHRWTHTAEAVTAFLRETTISDLAS